MKTKHLLTMAALTLGFAACTQDEIVENVVNNPMERAALENMTIEFAGPSVDSRLAYSDANYGWVWETGDKYSAFMVDGWDDWTADNDLATNYIYSQGEDGSYSTTSQMVEGMYWFFAPAKEDKLDRTLIKYELSTNQTEGYYKTTASQVYFSPIYMLEAKNNAANVVLKPYVYNFYSQAIFSFKNATPASVTASDINILQIILESADGTTKIFDTKGEISPKSIAAVSTYAYDADKAEFVETVETSGVLNTAENLKTADLSKDGGVAESASIALNIKKTLKRGETLTTTMLVPQVSNENMKVTVVTDKGEITINHDGTVAPSTDYTNVYAPELAGVSFKHHGAKYMFGKKSDNSIKPIEITVGNINTNSDYKYVASADDLVDLINDNHGAMTIKKVGDWAINEKVIAAANNNSNVVLTFADDMNVENNSSAEIELKNIAFGPSKGYTLTKGAVKSDITPKNVTGGKLNYTGTTATLKNNGGEITIQTALTGLSLTNTKGKVIINADVELSALTNGGATSVATLVVNSGKELTLDVTTATNRNYTSGNTTYYSEIEVNGELIIEDGTLTNNGVIKNNGTISFGTTTGVLKNSHEIANAGQIDGLNVADKGIINNGYIEMTEFEAAAINVQGNGIINNNANGFVTEATNGTHVNVIYFEASGNVSAVNSGCNLMVVKDGAIGTASVECNVLFLGASSIRTSLTCKNVYVFTADGGTYDALAKRLVAWADATKRAEYAATVKLTNYGTIATYSNGNYNLNNYAPVYNRGQVSNKFTVLDTTTMWQGLAPVAL